MPGTSSSKAIFGALGYQANKSGVFWSTPATSHVVQHTDQGYFGWNTAPSFSIWHG